MEKTITYMGQPAKVACDEKCNKAWGSNNRPRVYPEISEEKKFGLGEESIYPDDTNGIDVDNYAYCSDEELGQAPVDPGTYEGGQAKPTNKSEIGNKWCIRECERCSMSAPGKHNEPLPLKDLSKRFYNMFPHTRQETKLLDDLKLCAEFAGWKYDDDFEEWRENEIEHDVEKWFRLKNLKFHDSYDWQIKVWRKLFNECWAFSFRADATFKKFLVMRERYYRALDKGTLLESFSILAEAINFYNNNK